MRDMPRRDLSIRIATMKVWLAGIVLGLACLASPPAPVGALQQVDVVRFSQNPLITVDTSASLGGNVNGPHSDSRARLG